MSDSAVSQYIASCPIQTHEKLAQLREFILTVLPEAEEVISYKMPAYKFHGMLVYFAGYEKHIGFYPTGSGVKQFEHELSNYNFSKGTIQFRLDEPLPFELIQRILEFRINENLLKASGKKSKKV
jgi:uncharacterized protein YdhG (YjbR/CyaY superfamily)